MRCSEHEWVADQRTAAVKLNFVKPRKSQRGHVREFPFASNSAADD